MRVYLPLLAVSAVFSVAMAAGNCDCDDDDTDCLADCVTSTNQCLVSCGADNNCYANCFSGWPGAEKAQNYWKQGEASSMASPMPSESMPPGAASFLGSSMVPPSTMSASMHMGFSSVPYGMPTMSSNNQRWNQPTNAAEHISVKRAGTLAALFAIGFVFFA